MFAASHLKTLQGKATCEAEIDAATILTLATDAVKMDKFRKTRY